jgi:DNA-binding CsgD family transcriptional regulator
VSAADDLLGASPDGPAEQPWHPLTARQYTVATLVASGLTNREIAARLFLSPKTVSAHVEHILAKLGAARRTEIAAWAAKIKD